MDELSKEIMCNNFLEYDLLCGGFDIIYAGNLAELVCGF